MTKRVMQNRRSEVSEYFDLGCHKPIWRRIRLYQNGHEYQGPAIRLDFCDEGPRDYHYNQDEFMDDPIRVSAWCFFCQRKVQGLRKNFFYSL